MQLPAAKPCHHVLLFHSLRFSVKIVIVVTSDSDAHLQHLLDDRDGTMQGSCVLMPQSLNHVNYRMVIYVNSREKSKSTLNIFPPANCH